MPTPKSWTHSSWPHYIKHFSAHQVGHANTQILDPLILASITQIKHFLACQVGHANTQILDPLVLASITQIKHFLACQVWHANTQTLDPLVLASLDQAFSCTPGRACQHPNPARQVGHANTQILDPLDRLGLIKHAPRAPTALLFPNTPLEARITISFILN